MNIDKFKVLGVSQGQGALLFPFRKQLIGNIEPRGCFHTKGEEQWKINFGNIPFVRRPDQIDESVLKSADIIIGSPNCGASSILSYSRKKELGKPREDESILNFIGVVNMVKPMIFVMENLPKLLDFMPEAEWKDMFKEYSFVFHTNSVLEYGNSQKSRDRLVIIAVKKGTKVNINSFSKIFKVRKPKTTNQLMESRRLEPKYWPLNGNRRENASHKVCMYDYRDESKAKLELGEIRKLWTGDFKEYYKWPVNTARMKTLPGVYRNKGDNYPMTARKQDRQFKPNGVIMSPGELAVIQGLPIRFRIYMTTDPENKYWINKGRVTVTKGPVYEMGIWFKKCLKRS